jgi:hypothetical protein
MTDKNILLDFFNEIIDEIKELSDADLEKLKSGNFKIFLKVTKKKSINKISDSLSKEQITIVTDALKECVDRESGYNVLIEHIKSKNSLEAYAKSIDVFVMKQDNINRIREKIIEGTIGATLRSNAIQGGKT